MNKERTYAIVGVVILGLIVVGVLVLVNWPGGQILKERLAELLVGREIEAPAAQQKAPEPYVPKDGVITQVVIPIEKQADVIVDVTSAGFSPAEITITSGTVVLWTNRDKTPHWVVSPDYPERGGACGNKFDSCAGLKLGENLRLTFNRAGIWDYLDKLNPKFTGRVIVQ